MNTTNVNSPILSATDRTAGETRNVGGKKGKKSVEDQASEFQGELAQAGATSQPRIPENREPKLNVLSERQDGATRTAGSETMPSGKGRAEPTAEFSQAALNLNKGQMKAMQAATGPDSGSYLANSERFPQIQKAAASLNTGAAIAGLKPWSKDWVFEGRPQAGGTPIQPLFAPKQEPGALAELQQLIAAAAVQAGFDEAPDGMQGDLPGAMTPGVSGAMRDGRDAQEARDVRELLQMRSGADIAGPYGTANATDLTGLNGNLEANVSHGTGAMKGNAATGASALSGAEFLSTLNAVRDGSSSGVSGQSAQSGWTGTGEQGAGREERQAKPGLGSRPDFRVIEGGARGKRRTELGEGPAAQAGAGALGLTAGDRLGQTGMARPPMEVTGHVTQGAMAQKRLSSESLAGLSSGIRELKANGGGEIRIRLRPENLGELHLRVVAQGSNIGLQIQASDGHAKKIIEETMNHLKDSLASQNLQLGKVELSVAPASQGSESDASRRQDQGQQAQYQQGWQGMMGQNPGSQQGRSGHWSSVDPDAYPIGPGKSSARSAAATARTASANQRLDVIA